MFNPSYLNCPKYRDCKNNISDNVRYIVQKDIYLYNIVCIIFYYGNKKSDITTQSKKNFN